MKKIKQNKMSLKYWCCIFILLVACKQGLKEEFWPDGSFKIRESLEETLGGDELKVFKFYEEGVVDSTKYFRIEKYYKNGNKESQGNFVNGKKEGLWEYWYKNGEKALEENYNNGERVGHYKSWFPNGEVLEEFENYQFAK